MNEKKSTTEERLATIESKLDKILGLFEVSVKSPAKKEEPEKKEPTGPEKLTALAAQNEQEE